MPQYLGDLGCEHVVFKNDEKTVAEIAAMNPRGVLVSPGPGAGPRFARLSKPHALSPCNVRGQTRRQPQGVRRGAQDDA